MQTSLSTQRMFATLPCTSKAANGQNCYKHGRPRPKLKQVSDLASFRGQRSLSKQASRTMYDVLHMQKAWPAWRDDFNELFEASNCRSASTEHRVHVHRKPYVRCNLTAGRLLQVTTEQMSRGPSCFSSRPLCRKGRPESCDAASLTLGQVQGQGIGVHQLLPARMSEITCNFASCHINVTHDSGPASPCVKSTAARATSVMPS